MKLEKHSDISSVMSVGEGTAPGTFRARWGRSLRYTDLGKYLYDHCEHFELPHFLKHESNRMLSILRSSRPCYSSTSTFTRSYYLGIKAHHTLKPISSGDSTRPNPTSNLFWTSFTRRTASTMSQTKMQTQYLGSSGLKVSKVIL